MKKIKILITAGGTSEKIDAVRKITNTATGKLASFIAKEFIKKTKCEINYICSENAIIPDSSCIEVTKVASTNNLKHKIVKHLTNSKFDAVIHTMAVSDYKVKGITSMDDLSSKITKIILQNKNLLENPKDFEYIITSLISQNIQTLCNDKKINSNIDNLILFMTKNIKIIKIIKKLQPETILVGFKLLSGVSDDILLQAGHKLLIKNNCDFVFANNLDNISLNHHEGMIIENNYSYKHISTKQAIAKEIVNKVLEKLNY